MESRELQAVRRARRRRKRLGRLILAVTLSVGLVTGTLLLIMPGFSPLGARPAAHAPSAARELPEAPPVPPRVRVHGDIIELDGVAIARTTGIERLQRVEPLYEALHRRRLEETATGPGERPRRLLLDIDTSVTAVVVKSVFQTAAFAGYVDVAFVLPDGGTLP